MRANDLNASAIQCWTSLQKNYGVNVCTLMSFMSDQLMPSACEVDVTGVVSMYALQLASGQPAALVDWNNNYANDPDKCVLFHCGNWAKTFYPDVKMSNAPIIGSTVGVENTYGALEGAVPPGPMSYARLTTDDKNGQIKTYVGDGEFTDDPIETFGSRAVVKVDGLQQLLKYVCRNGFEHHTAMTLGYTGAVLEEAFGNYLGWEVYHHQG
jgi:L-fucose isomerase-like protein